MAYIVLCDIKLEPSTPMHLENIRSAMATVSNEAGRQSVYIEFDVIIKFMNYL